MIHELFVLTEPLNGSRHLFPNKYSRIQECDSLLFKRPKNKWQALWNRTLTKMKEDYDSEVLQDHVSVQVEVKERMEKLNT